MRWSAILALLLGPAADIHAIDEMAGIKTLHSLPRSQLELETAHRRSRSDACETIDESQPLETTTFTTILTNRDRQDGSRANLMPAIRQAIFSVGLSIPAMDRSKLPMLSRGKITDYLAKHYVIIEARVRRDLIDNKLYFHHRPIAVTAQFGGAKLSQNFEKIVSDNIREFHSLGLFTKKEGRLKPENLRTLVLIFKNTVLTPGGRGSTDRYEFAFVCGRESNVPARLEMHSFVTSDDRGTVTYLSSYVPPAGPALCSILGNVVITDYDATGVYPRDSATKSYRLDARKKFTMSQLEKYCAEQKLIGGFSKNVDTVLSAIIDGEISAESSLFHTPAVGVAKEKLPE